MRYTISSHFACVDLLAIGDYKWQNIIAMIFLILKMMYGTIDSLIK